MKTTHILFCILLAAGMGCGCKKKPAITAAAHAGGTLRTDEVLAVWRNTGLAPDAFATMTPPPYGAVYCERGYVQSLDTTICEFADDDAASAGTQLVKQEWATFDVSTALALVNQRTTIFVVDRQKREPSGKSMRQMAKAFSKL